MSDPQDGTGCAGSEGEPDSQSDVTKTPPENAASGHPDQAGSDRGEARADDREAEIE